MKVYYNGNYWGGHKYEHAGKELAINKEFEWAGSTWYLPSIYICAKGLVIDFCIKFEKELYEDFITKVEEINIDELTEAERQQLEYENPFSININVNAKLNGREPHESSMCSVYWHPFSIEHEEVDKVAEELMDYYKCDRSHCWKFIRASFPWTTAKKPILKEIELTLSEHPVSYSGEHFVTDDLSVGKEFTITHPLNKERHKLKIHKCESITLPENATNFLQNQQLPSLGKAITYSIYPDLEPNEFRIIDCKSSDHPRTIKTSTEPSIDNTSSCGVIGIIGGADGPTAVFMSGGYSKQAKERIACSSLHFEPVSMVEWRTLFYIKRNDDFNLTISL